MAVPISLRKPGSVFKKMQNQIATSDLERPPLKIASGKCRRHGLFKRTITPHPGIKHCCLLKKFGKKR
jgi:hypothetical protein